MKSSQWMVAQLLASLILKPLEYSRRPKLEPFKWRLEDESLVEKFPLRLKLMMQCSAEDEAIFDLSALHKRWSQQNKKTKEKCVKNIQKSCNQHLQMTPHCLLTAKSSRKNFASRHASVSSLLLIHLFEAKHQYQAMSKYQGKCPLPFPLFITVKYVGWICEK